ncbi:MAG TPA: glycosyltransferase family 2 protein [Vicinamibacterales bacterium]|nr:glycosyltransferase family 2 protein [Vicinamibacterales bacterium]
MKLSIYTSVRNGIFLDLHIVAMLRHHLELADEIVVNEGFSDDDTYERIRDIDPKIRIHRQRWDASAPSEWHRRFGNQARRLCTGDWCLKLDCDEFVPEWEFDRLRRTLETTDRSILPLRFLNFYANYRVLNVRPERSRWTVSKWVVHRNVDDAEVVGDGAGVILRSDPHPVPPDDMVSCHHFGAVRNPARLRQNWRNEAAMKRSRPGFDRVPSVVYDLMPHDWFDRDFMEDLAVYDGPVIRAVRENPDEFIRDGLRVYDWLKVKAAARPVHA